MSGADRCDEIMRLIDEALDECEVAIAPRVPEPLGPIRVTQS